MKSLGCPSAETSSHLRLDTIAQSDDHVKIIVVNVTFYLTISLLTN